MNGPSSCHRTQEIEMKVTVLGLNGHIGIALVRGIRGGRARGHRLRPQQQAPRSRGCSSSRAMRRASRTSGRAIGDADVVVNALNLRYDQWDKGRLEAQVAPRRRGDGDERQDADVPGQHLQLRRPSAGAIGPDDAADPGDAPRGASGSRVEALIEAAARRGDMQAIIIRAGDFFGPDCTRRLVRAGHPARSRQGQGGAARQAGRRPCLGLSAGSRAGLRARRRDREHTLGAVRALPLRRATS